MVSRHGVVKFSKYLSQKVHGTIWWMIWWIQLCQFHHLTGRFSWGFLQVLDLLNCFVGFKDRKGFSRLWLASKIWQNIKMKTTLSKSNVKSPSLPKRRLGWGLGIQSGLESIAYKRNEKSENSDDQSNSTAVTDLSINQTASYERHFTHNLCDFFCGF